MLKAMHRASQKIPEQCVPTDSADYVRDHLECALLLTKQCDLTTVAYLVTLALTALEETTKRTNVA